MKRKGDPKAPKRVKISWDEGNLVENERIKAELAPTKIEEPKTPFHSPPREEVDDPFEEHHYDPTDGPEKADVDEVEGKPSEATSRGPCSGAGDSGTQVAMEGNSAGASENVMDSELMRYWEDTPGRIKVSTDKEPAFADSRKQHYDMKEALRRGRELIEEDAVEEVEEDEDEGAVSQADGAQAQTKCQ